MFRVLNFFIFFVFILVSPICAKTDSKDVSILSDGLNAIEYGKWSKSHDFSKKIKDPVAKIILEWSRLRAGHGDWIEYQSFLSRNSKWPGLKKLRERAEKQIPKNTNSQDILDFFGTERPQTAWGTLRLVDALLSEKQDTKATKIFIDSWKTLSLTSDSQSDFLNHEIILTNANHIDRLNNLLWRGDVISAKRILNLFPKSMQKLINARIGLQLGSSNVDQLISKVPDLYKNDAGLAYDRFQWRIRKNRWDDAQDLLIDRTKVSSSLGRPEKWASRRRGFARRAMRESQPKVAYYLASNHQLTNGADYADLEWLSGYISMTYLNEAKQALKHFENFKMSVSSPISKGRAGYWLGKIYEKLGHLKEAEKNYKFSARYQFTYYGQLSSERLGLIGDKSFIDNEHKVNWETASFVNNTVFQAAVILHQAKRLDMMRWFMTHMAETLDRDELLKLTNFTNEKNISFVEIGIAKQAAKRGIILPKAYFPINDISIYPNDLPLEVLLSVARRESELNANAISPAGAIGLMQILPSTARQMAKELGIKYSKKRLKSDSRYNVKFGATYLIRLIEKYEGSYLLAFAAYNAGPRKVDEWIELYGDPRDPVISVVDWIEHIPYKETRNYVMRVTESLYVYRSRINGFVEPIGLIKDLKRY